jgi:hypothetical protein
MITSETPYKLAEIIRDTWPGLYRKPEVSYNKDNYQINNDWKSGTRRKCDESR